MAEKRYYWLKLQENFFDQKIIKKLRGIAGGDTYTVIYLKMMLASIKRGGYILYEGIEDTFTKELALAFDEKIENMDMLLGFLKNFDLLIESDEKPDASTIETFKTKFFLPGANENIGTESASAQRVRKFRESQKNGLALQCNSDVTNGNADVTNGNADVTLYREEQRREEKSRAEQKNKSKVLESIGINGQNLMTLSKDESITMSLIALLLPEAKSKKNPAGWLYKALLEKYDRPLSTNEKHVPDNEKHVPDIECTICHGRGYYIKTENDR